MQTIMCSFKHIIDLLIVAILEISTKLRHWGVEVWSKLRPNFDTPSVETSTKLRPNFDPQCRSLVEF